MSGEIEIDDLVAVHQKMSAKMSELQKQIDDIEADRNTVRETILTIMKEKNIEAVRTKHGTVTKSVKERYWPSDWTVFNQYVLEHGAVDLLEKRVHQTNIKEWIETHRDDFPPALNIDRSYTITVKKAKGD